jgi:glycosyltransferase involved in cell wall biosynthesis
VQRYRPIEIVVVDDNSPIPLVVSDRVSDENLQVRLFRNSVSYGPYWNMQKSISLAKGKYVYQIDHDDYLIDPNFIEKAVAHFESNPNLQLVIANSEIENSHRTTFSRSSQSNFQLFDGLQFLSKHLFKDIHPARSGYIMNYQSLVNINFEDVFYPLNYFDGSDIYPDESFSLPVILCGIGDVMVSHSVVSIRGNPQDSFSKSKFWRDNSSISVIVQHLRLTNFLFSQRKLKVALIILIKSILGGGHSPAIRFHNLKILGIKELSLYDKLVILSNFLAHFPTFLAKRTFFFLRFRVLGR